MKWGEPGQAGTHWHLCGLSLNLLRGMSATSCLLSKTQTNVSLVISNPEIRTILLKSSLKNNNKAPIVYIYFALELCEIHRFLKVLQSLFWDVSPMFKGHSSSYCTCCWCLKGHLLALLSWAFISGMHHYLSKAQHAGSHRGDNQEGKRKENFQEWRVTWAVRTGTERLRVRLSSETKYKAGYAFPTIRSAKTKLYT